MPGDEPKSATERTPLLDCNGNGHVDADEFLDPLQCSSHIRTVITTVMSMASGMDSLESNPEQSDDEEVKHEEDPDFYLSPGGSLRRVSGRPDHLRALIENKRESVRYISNLYKEEPLDSEHLKVTLSESEKQKAREDTEFLKHGGAVIGELRKHFPLKNNQVEIRIKDLNYCVVVNPAVSKIQTVFNQSLSYKFWKWVKRVWQGQRRPEKQMKYVLENINLVLKPGKMYLVLGPPASGSK
jgi:ABC-type multidrug transport system fused ATPase/permease subunit